MALQLRTIAAVPVRAGRSAAGVGRRGRADRSRRDARGGRSSRPAARAPSRRSRRCASAASPRLRRRARLRWLVAVFVAVGVAGLLVWPRDLGWDGLLRSTAVYVLLFGAVLLAPVVLGALGRVARAALPARVPARGAARPRGDRPRPRPDDADRRGARDRPRDGRRGRGGRPPVAARGGGLAARRDPRRRARSPRSGRSPSTRSVLADVAAVDGVARVSPIATFDVARDGVRYDAAAVRGADLAADGRLTFLLGDRAEALAGLDRGGVAILPAGRRGPDGPDGRDRRSASPWAAARSRISASRASSSGRCRGPRARRSSSAGQTRRGSSGRGRRRARGPLRPGRGGDGPAGRRGARPRVGARAQPAGVGRGRHRRAPSARSSGCSTRSR